MTRALPDKHCKHRYILTDKNKNWKSLGLKPIIYPPGSHDVLNNSLTSLLIFLKGNMRSWKNRYKEICKNPPNESVSFEVELIINNPDTVVFLKEYPTTNFDKWAMWFRDKGYFSFITQETELTKSQQYLSYWLIIHGDKSQQLFEVLSTYESNNNPFNKYFIIYMLNLINSPDITTQTFQKCIVLFEYEINNLDNDLIVILFSNIIRKNLFDLGLNIFKNLIKPKYALNTSSSGYACIGKFTLEHDTNMLSYIWKKQIFNNIEVDHLKYLISFLEDLILKMEYKDKCINPISSNSFVVNLEEQIGMDCIKDPYLLILKILIESLDITLTKDNMLFHSTIENYINKNSYSLKKTAIISLHRNSKSLSISKKINFIINNISLFDIN